MDIMKRKSIVFIVLLSLILTLTACGKSEFGVTENTWKHMTITAQNADKDAFFMVGSLDVADGEQIDIAANLTKGSVRVEIVRSSDNQLGKADCNPFFPLPRRVNPTGKTASPNKNNDMEDIITKN